MRPDPRRRSLGELGAPEPIEYGRGSDEQADHQPGAATIDRDGGDAQMNGLDHAVGDDEPPPARFGNCSRLVTFALGT